MSAAVLLVTREEDRAPDDVAELAFRPLGEPGVGVQVTSLAFAPDEPEHLYLGGDLLGIGRSVDGGASWTPGEGLLGWEMSSLLAHADDEVWVGTMSGPVLSTDGGRSWQARRAGMPQIRSDAYTAPVQPILQDPRDPDSLLALGGTHRRWPSADTSGFGAVWASTDRGQRGSGSARSTRAPTASSATSSTRSPSRAIPTCSSPRSTGQGSDARTTVAAPGRARRVACPRGELCR